MASAWDALRESEVVETPKLTEADVTSLDASTTALVSQSEATLNPHTAFKALNNAKLQSDNGADPYTALRESSAAVREGTISNKLSDSISTERQATFTQVYTGNDSDGARIQAAMGYLLGDKEEYIGIMGGASASKRNATHVKALELNDNELKKQAQKDWKQPQKDELLTQAVLDISAASGGDPEILKKISDPNIIAKYNDKTKKIEFFSEGVQEPVYSIVDLPIDIASGGTTLAMRASAKGAKAGVQAGLRALVKEADVPIEKFFQQYFAREVMYSGMTGAFMTAVEAQGSGGAFTMLSGVIGPAATVALFKTSRIGAQRYLTAIKRDVTKYRELRKALESSEDSVGKSKVLSILDEMDLDEANPNPAKTRALDGTKFVAESPVARTAKDAVIMQDQQGLDSVKESVNLAVSNDPEISRLAQVAQDSDEASHIPLVPITRAEQSTDIFGYLDEVDSAYPVERLGALEDTLDSLEGHTDLASKIINSHDINRAVSSQIMDDVINSASVEARGVISEWGSKGLGLYRKGGLADEAIAKMAIGTSGSKFKFFRNPLDYLGIAGKAMVEVSTSNERTARRLNKAYTSYFDNYVWKGLSEGESKLVDEALFKMTDRDETMVVVSGGLAFKSDPDDVMYMPDKLINRIANARVGFEHAYDAANKVAVQTYKNRGFKFYRDEFVVRERTKAIPATADMKRDALYIGRQDMDGKTWTKELEKEGWVAAEIHDVANPKAPTIFKYLSPEEANALIKDIPDNARVSPYRANFTPVRYDDKYIYSIVKVSKDANGVHKAERVAGSRWKKEVEKTLKELNTNSSKEAGVNYTAYRRDVSNDAIEQSYTDSYVNALRDMSDKELVNYKRALQASGMSVDEVDMVIATANRERVPKSAVFKYRGDKRLRKAGDIAANIQAGMTADEAILAADTLPMLPGKSMTARYSAQVSRYIGHTDWNAKLAVKFKELYGNALEDPTDWKSPVKEIDALANPILSDSASVKNQLSFAKEATAMQDYLKMLHNIPSKKLMESRVAMQNHVDGLIQESPTKVHEYYANLMLEYFADGVFPTVSRGVRTVAYHGLLGLGTLKQLFVQSSTMLNSGKYLFSNPTVLVDATKDSFSVTMSILAHHAPGIPKDTYGTYLYDLLKRSGYNTGVNYDAVKEAMIDTTTTIGKASYLTRGALAVGSAPARLGENVGRMQIWFAERRLLEQEIKAGVREGLEIDSDEALSIININADRSAGNFLKYNQASMQKAEDIGTSIASMSTQFMSYPIFQLGYMSPFNKDMTKTELIGLWTTWGYVFGLKGIPLFWDAVMLKESIDESQGEGAKGDTKLAINNFVLDSVRHITNNPYETESVRKYFAKKIDSGVVPYPLAARAQLAEQLTRYADGIQASELAGPGANFIFKTVSNVISAGSEASVLDMVKTASETIPGIYDPLSLASDNFVDKRGRMVREDLTMREKLWTLTGLGIPEEVARNTASRDKYIRSQSLDAMVNNLVNKCSEKYLKDPKDGEEFSREVYIKLDNPKLQQVFLKKIILRTMSGDLSAEQREQYENMMFFKRYFEMPTEMEY